MKKSVLLLVILVLLGALIVPNGLNFNASSENTAIADSVPIWPMFGYNAEHTRRCPYDTSSNNGELEWKFVEHPPYGVVEGKPAISTDGTIYAGTTNGYLLAFNPNGTLKWSYYTWGKTSSSPAIASDGTIYVGSEDGYLYAINPNGTLKWRYQTGNTIYASPAIASDGTIYVGSEDHYLYAINPNGTLKWKYQTWDRIYASPAIASDGTIYVGSKDGYLYAIGSIIPPSPPQSLTATADSNSITLNWSPSTQGTYPIAGYAIYRGISSGGESPVPIATVNNHTFTYKDSHVTAGTTYYYYVKAFDNQDPPIYSQPSNEVSAKVVKQKKINIDTTPPSVSIPNVKENGSEIVDKGNLSIGLIESDNSGNIAKTVVKDNGIILKEVNGPISRLDLPLREGINDIEIIVYDPSGNYTAKKFRIISDTKPPVVKINLAETSLSKQITLKGKIFDTTTGVRSVKINREEVELKVDGALNYSLTLSPGKNVIEIQAIDKAGNVATKTFTVTYTPSKQVSSSMIQLQIGNPFIEVDGFKKLIDKQGSKPIIRNNRTLLPIRVIIESLGGTISWNPKTREVTIKLNGHTIILTIGKNTAIVDGIKTQIDQDNPNVVPIIINGRTYIPLRFVTEYLNCMIDWDPSTKTVTIYYFG